MIVRFEFLKGGEICHVKVVGAKGLEHALQEARRSGRGVAKVLRATEFRILDNSTLEILHSEPL